MTRAQFAHKTAQETRDKKMEAKDNKDKKYARKTIGDKVMRLALRGKMMTEVRVPNRHNQYVVKEELRHMGFEVNNRYEKGKNILTIKW